ncbi:MAG: helix-turn-helix domain-containing protein [Treponema sp.]|jgi:transcriptional regulator with XRE-family HTH domain|nr:helix-turn-helix domain-containing protein [Treponema sp.]
MLRKNLKEAISKSGKYVKEIASISKVNKRTIDKWLGVEKIKPNVEDIYKVCSALDITVEWLLTGEDDKKFRLNPDEQKLLIKYRKIDDQGRYEIDTLLSAKLRKK